MNAGTVYFLPYGDAGDTWEWFPWLDLRSLFLNALLKARWKMLIPIIEWIFIILFFGWITVLFIEAFGIAKSTLILLAILAIFTGCVLITLHVQPTWKENWRWVVIVAQLIYILIGVPISQIGKNSKDSQNEEISRPAH